MQQHTIGIAGVGKMGEALVRGLIVGRVVPASRILVSDAIPARAREIAAKHGVTSLDTVADDPGTDIRLDHFLSRLRYVTFAGRLQDLL